MTENTKRILHRMSHPTRHDLGQAAGWLFFLLLMLAMLWLAEMMLFGQANRYGAG